MARNGIKFWSIFFAAVPAVAIIAADVAAISNEKAPSETKKMIKMNAPAAGSSDQPAAEPDKD